jgi:hypothetical protein
MHLFGWSILLAYMDLRKELWCVDIFRSLSRDCLWNVSHSISPAKCLQPLIRSPRFWATVAPVGAEVVGLQILPSALSIAWLVLVLPCTFAEPIGLEMRTTSGDIYLHAQIFTGFMYIGAALCMWFLRAWKIGELERTAATKEDREQELRDDDMVMRERPGMLRHHSRTSVKSKAQAAKGLWSWQRV